MPGYTQSGTIIATGSVRVVHGGRGSYAEFTREQLVWEHLEIPADQEWRLEEQWASRIFYLEYRSRDDAYVKVYEQLRVVGYADYRVGFFYIAEGELKWR
jgi:hypothetical protein